MENHIYGGIDIVHANRFGINSSLPESNIPATVVHELIHVEQKHRGLLKIQRNGVYFWYNIPYKVDLDTMTYEQYRSQPWEHDVEVRLPALLKMLSDQT